jgi:hypothetical protein
MGDYAISAVGRASGNERIAGSGPSNESIRFEQIGNEMDNPWDTINGSQNRIRIMQEPSSVDAPALKRMNAWDNISSHVATGIENFQHIWSRAMAIKDSDISDKSPMSGKGDSQSSLDLEKTLRGMRNWSLRIILAQAGMAYYTSAAETIKNSVSTLYRQQG